MTPYAFVSAITERFGPRPPGSDAERAAQAWIGDALAADFGARTVTREPFRAAVGAKFGSLPVFFTAVVLSLPLAWVHLPAAAGLAGLSALLFLGHFVAYRDWLDPFWPKAESANVWADLEPEGPVRGTLVLAGHADSATEFRWWWRWGQAGLLLNLAGGFGLVLPAPILGVLAIFGPSVPELPAWGPWVWGAAVLLALPAVTLATLHGERNVDGAIDNLSGVALARELGRRFALGDRPGQSRLRHTRLRVMSFGSEECGLKGSRAYVRAHREALRAEGAVLINLESFRDDRHLTLLTREVFTGARYPPELNRRLGDAFRASGRAYRENALLVGATDATSFAAAGLPAACLIGLDSDRLDPTYHTRLDHVAQLDPAGMDAAADALERFIVSWDAEA